ncbi:MAG: InlB B-repeat-containing protein, partial [Oscillibacter sp.]|nr:InlB B-repeat-containing protein [Oscillibacter sp.]
MDAGAEYKLPDCGFTAPEGKRFAGWTTGNSTEVLTVGASVTISADTTLTARWEDIPVNACTVTFDANGGTGTMDAVTVDYGTEYALPASRFTPPEGMAFDGWSIDSRDYAVGDTLSVTEDITAAARWKLSAPPSVTTVTIITQDLPDVIQYVPFRQQLSCYAASPGGESVSTENVVWSGSGLPDGVSLSADGLLTGAVRQSGKFSFSVTASLPDEDSKADTVSLTLSVRRIESVNLTSLISDGCEILDRIPDMYDYVDQTFRIAASLSGFQDLWVDGEKLKSGQDFTASEGSTRLNITANTFKKIGEGTHTAVAQFLDEDGNTQLAAQAYTVDLSAVVRLEAENLPDAVQFVPYHADVQAVPHYAGMSFELQGIIPDGWSINPATGELTGIPKQDGVTYTFHIGLKTADGTMAAEKEISIRVKDNIRQNVTEAANLNYKVLESIPDMTAVTTDQEFVSEGEFRFFKDFYLNGVLQTKDVDYSVQDYGGKTRITVFAQALRRLGVGEHTAAATFAVKTKDGRQETWVSSQNFSTSSASTTPGTSSGGGGGGSSG